MVQRRVLFLMEQVYCSLIRRSHLNCISDYYLIWVVISRQAVNGITQAVKKAFERRGYSFRVIRRKTGHQRHTFLLGIQTPYRNRKEKKVAGDEFYKILPKCCQIFNVLSELSTVCKESLRG